MRILYTPVGDTDPIRGCYDGGMLHIVRHYNPDMAILILSKDMEQKEESNRRFSKALKHVKADLDIKLICTGLEDVHKRQLYNRLLTISMRCFQNILMQRY